MASYNIVIDRRVRKKDLVGLPSADVKRIVAAIAALADNPRPPQAKRLTNRQEYRLRQGDYRILYTIDDEIRVVAVVKVGQRGDVYR
jgi:mRNA interferase RelE/StbE